MTAVWKKHCPYDINEHPSRWRAWRRGWMYRKTHGPVTPAKKTVRKMIKQRLFSSWLQGYTTAEKSARLLDLLEETYGSRHPDFKTLCWAFERITSESEGSRAKDARLVLVGLIAAERAYEHWHEFSGHDKENALKAIERVRDTTVPLLEDRGIDLH